MVVAPGHDDFARGEKQIIVLVDVAHAILPLDAVNDKFSDSFQLPKTFSLRLASTMPT